jgi:hypothetical protein
MHRQITQRITSASMTLDSLPVAKSSRRISSNATPSAFPLAATMMVLNWIILATTGGNSDLGLNDERFASKVKNFTLAHPSASFTGPLEFLNSYEYQMLESYLTGLGAATEFQAGATFWNRYGRTLYNASIGQVSYNASFPNGTARPKPVLRTTSQSRIYNSEINWSLGSFGPSFNTTPNPKLEDATPYRLVVIPEGGTENNTLASYDSCANYNVEAIGYIGDADLFTYKQPPAYRSTLHLASNFQLTILMHSKYAIPSPPIPSTATNTTTRASAPTKPPT